MKELRTAQEQDGEKLNQTDNYVEKYLPFKIQNQISETLEYCLDKKNVLRLKDFDTKRYRRFQERVS